MPARALKRRAGRAALILVGTASLVAPVIATPAGPAGATTDPGQGSASATTAAVIPRDGSLAIGVTLGEALAGHTNDIGKGQSQAIDFGAIGDSLTSYNCNQPPAVQPDQLPQPLIVETGQPGASQGITQSDAGGAFTKFAQADKTPYAEAVTTSGPLGMAGIISIGAGISKSWSGLVNGQRQAGATSDLAGITLPGGISLSGLHWEAVYQSTGTPQVTGSFSIAHATTTGGVPIQTADPAQTLTQLNAALNPLGLELVAPTSHVTSGIEYVDPLQISVVPNQARDTALNAILTGIQPIRQPLFAAVLQAFCQADSFITVADVALASISGGGSLDIYLGGVQATSGTLPVNTFNLGQGNFQLGGGSVGTTGSVSTPTGSSTSYGTPGTLGSLGTPGTSGTPGTPGSPGIPGTAVSSPSTGTGATTRTALAAVKPASALVGKRGGALAAVGLACLGLLALMIEGDRRKMRRALRTVTFKE
ncbi:MAG: hypothetical protein ACYCS7_13280 [Acidimicrobiales bacterium]